MIRTIALLVALAATLVLSSTATAATKPPTRAEFNAVRSSLATARAEVVQLRREVTTLRATVGAVDERLATVNDKDTCTTALTWDAIGIIANYLFSANLSRLDDGGACLRIGVTRSGTSRQALAAISPGARLAELTIAIEAAK